MLNENMKNLKLSAVRALEEYLEGLLGLKVDLVSRDALKPRIGARILKEVVYIRPIPGNSLEADARHAEQVDPRIFRCRQGDSVASGNG
jgi:hypothetical protein